MSFDYVGLDADNEPSIFQADGTMDLKYYHDEGYEPVSVTSAELGEYCRDEEERKRVGHQYKKYRFVANVTLPPVVPAAQRMEMFESAWRAFKDGMASEFLEPYQLDHRIVHCDPPDLDQHSLADDTAWYLDIFRSGYVPLSRMEACRSKVKYKMISPTERLWRYGACETMCRTSVGFEVVSEGVSYS